MNKMQKNDFIEIEFIGKTKEGEVFDSNKKEEIEKAGLKVPSKPFIFCLGAGMFLGGVEDYLTGKEIGEYKIELSPENAFGHRDSKLIQMIPMKMFKEQKVNPFPGALFNFDGKIAKVLTVSGGRVMVDFNNPLAGKDVEYDVKVLRKIEKPEEKIKSLNEFLFKKNFDFEIKDKKVIMKVEKSYVQFVNMFKDKFKELLGLELEVKEIEPKIPEKTQENKSQ